VGFLALPINTVIILRIDMADLFATVAPLLSSSNQPSPLFQAVAPLLAQVQQVPVLGTQLAGAAQSALSGAAGNNPVVNSKDTRIRLAALNPAGIYTNGGSSVASPLMAILAETNGMLFPYTPSITVNQSIDYQNIALVHSNTDYQAYTRTQSVKISINGKFSVQNQREGVYALAAIHFLRTVSKSYFGETDAKAGKAGLPPPVLVFSGYGNFMFNNLRVILTSHSLVFDESMDTVPISIQAPTLALKSVQTSTVSGIVRLPAMFTLSCELLVIQTPTRMRTTFSFADFASGKLMTGQNDGWI
jgi:hypothetical protein